MRALIGLAILSTFAACASPEQQAANQAQYERIEGNLQRLHLMSAGTCDGPVSCEKLWTLTQEYVERSADQRVRIATGTLIESYEPTNYQRVGLKATLETMPGEGTKKIARLTPSCMGMYSTEGTAGPFYDECVVRISQIYKGFVPFMAARARG